MNNYYVFFGTSGNITGTGSGDGTFIPDGAIECTQAQAQNPQQYIVSNGAIISAPGSVLLAAAQSTQIAALTKSYNAAIITPVAFTTTAGVASTYQADAISQQYLARAVTGYRIAGSVPSGFYWRSAGNTNVPFTFADLEGLYTAMLTQGWQAFVQLQNLKAQVMAATTISAVQAVVWP